MIWGKWTWKNDKRGDGGEKGGGSIAGFREGVSLHRIGQDRAERDLVAKIEGDERRKFSKEIRLVKTNLLEGVIYGDGPTGGIKKKEKVCRTKSQKEKVGG